MNYEGYSKAWEVSTPIKISEFVATICVIKIILNGPLSRFTVARVLDMLEAFNNALNHPLFYKSHSNSC